MRRNILSLLWSIGCHIIIIITITITITTLLPPPALVCIYSQSTITSHSLINESTYAN